MSKRTFVLAFATVMVLCTIALAIFMSRQDPPWDPAGLYGTSIVMILPALLLGYFNRVLGLAIVLLCIAAFMYLSLSVFGGVFG